MAQRRKKNEIEKTQEFLAKSQAKKKSHKKLWLSIGTIGITTALAVGIVLSIDAAKHDEI